jgi:hypothetical protein
MQNLHYNNKLESLEFNRWQYHITGTSTTVDVYPTLDSNADVIYNVHWRITGTDDANNDADGNAITGSIYGTQSLDTADISSFTSFADVSAATVQGWVEAAIGDTYIGDQDFNNLIRI